MRAFFGAACFVPALLLGAFTGMALYEWWVVGVAGDPEVLSQYPFGTEGFPQYSSPQKYATYQLVGAAVAIALSAVFIGAWFRRSGVILAGAYAIALGVTAWSVSRSL
jgi:hypothetical protein